MPSPKKPSDLETRIQHIVSRAAQEISSVVRLDLVGEIQKAIDSLARHGFTPHAPTAAKAAAAPAKRPESRKARPAKPAKPVKTIKTIKTVKAVKPVKPVKTVEVDHLPKATGEHAASTGDSAAAPSGIASGSAAGTKKSGAGKKPLPNKKEENKSWKRRLISDAELEVVIDVLKKTPGLTSLELQRASGIDAKQAARVLGKLRDTSKVTWVGARSAAKYTVA